MKGKGARVSSAARLLLLQPCMTGRPGLAPPPSASQAERFFCQRRGSPAPCSFPAMRVHDVKRVMGVPRKRGSCPPNRAAASTDERAV